MGVLAFGLSKPQTLAIACGVIVSAWGPVQILVYLRVSHANLLLSHPFPNCVYV